MFILCAETVKTCAAASEHIFYVSANGWLLLAVFQCFVRNGRLLLKDINMRLLLKENEQLVFFYVEDCVAASGNISIFLINVRLLLKRYDLLLLNS